ncbi:TetR/AcrR family transcriptional regulator C-terminal domain-containing protein [Kitasatospora sp. NA04385]|uniref:TetR/AcrR family transcriptional regulator n=1 Tax=Kitasatospora sp. NA04385 TaxID=2742135 RepID=UPI00159027C7|nr:TetR/AcrR family transcriptional regulator C-terminal domain-containing protein [Kitasatospora sp. NA04385]QKW23188.1 TetR/AcrR family transcriptional regulator C-terminal domain-containing protein [Kitasatospora sp. NA04385]
MPEPARIPAERRRRRPTKNGTVLTEEAIVTAALELIEAPSGNALTVRRLGTALGCDPSTVYRYFADTDALLLAAADRLIGDSLDGFVPDPDWRTALRDFAVRVHSSVLRHPRLAAVRASRMTAGPAERRAVDTGIGLLLRAGFTPAEAVGHYRTFIDTVLAHATLDADVLSLSERQRTQQAELWRAADTLPPEEYPHLHAVRDHLPDLAASAFPETLDILLAHLAARAPRRTAPTA